MTARIGGWRLAFGRWHGPRRYARTPDGILVAAFGRAVFILPRFILPRTSLPTR